VESCASGAENAALVGRDLSVGEVGLQGKYERINTQHDIP